MSHSSLARTGDFVSVGAVLREADLAHYADRFPELIANIQRSGIDRVVLGDHVAFRGGAGADGLIHAASLLGANPVISVQTGVYLLPLRHPVLVARQLSSLSLVAPGRFIFGVGVGGEDPAEFVASGVDLKTRGKRTDASLEVLQDLLRGGAVSHESAFFTLDNVRVTPPPQPAIPILIGGRSDAALRRTSEYGDGWIALWVSPERYLDATRSIDVLGKVLQPHKTEWRHQLQVWCGFGDGRSDALRRAAPLLEELYGLPFKRFAKYTPVGNPEGVAEKLGEYAQAGCREFNITPAGLPLDEALDAIGEVGRLLRREGL